MAVQTIALPMPPPMMPSSGIPSLPKISDQLTSAFSGMPALLMTRTQRGRSSAETKFRMHWNSIQGGMTHM